MSLFVEFKWKIKNKSFEAQIVEDGVVKTISLIDFIQKEKTDKRYKRAIAKLKEIAQKNKIDIADVLWAFGDDSRQYDLSIIDGAPIRVDTKELERAGIYA